MAFKTSCKAFKSDSNNLNNNAKKNVYFLAAVSVGCMTKLWPKWPNFQIRFQVMSFQAVTYVYVYVYSPGLRN
jgi:hypothetical protein